MYYNHYFIKRFEKNCIYRQSCRLHDSASRGVVFWLWISPRIRSVRDLSQTDLCKNPRKSASLPCPFKHSTKEYTLADGWTGVLYWMDIGPQCVHFPDLYPIDVSHLYVSIFSACCCSRSILLYSIGRAYLRLARSDLYLLELSITLGAVWVLRLRTPSKFRLLRGPVT